MRLIILVLFCFLVFEFQAQISPDQFPELTEIDDTNFEVYSQKNGTNTKASVSTIKKATASGIVTVIDDPNNAGNTINLGNFVSTASGKVFYISMDGTAIQVGGGQSPGTNLLDTIYKALPIGAETLLNTNKFVPIYFDPAGDPQLAKADNGSTTHQIYITDKLDSGSTGFIVKQSGYIDVSSHNYTLGKYIYLDSITAGNVSHAKFMYEDVNAIAFTSDRIYLIDNRPIFRGIEESENLTGAVGAIPYFRSEGLISDDSNLFIDESSNRIGINSNAPTAMLDISEQGNDTSKAALRLRAGNDGGRNLTTSASQIQFSYTNGAAYTHRLVSRHTSSRNGLYWYTWGSGQGSADLGNQFSMAMIDDRVLIGGADNTIPQRTLHVNGDLRITDTGISTAFNGLFGRNATGDYGVISLGTNLSFTDNVLNATSQTASNGLIKALDDIQLGQSLSGGTGAALSNNRNIPYAGNKIRHTEGIGEYTDVNGIPFAIINGSEASIFSGIKQGETLNFASDNAMNSTISNVLWIKHSGTSNATDYIHVEIPNGGNRMVMIEIKGFTQGTAGRHQYDLKGSAIQVGTGVISQEQFTDNSTFFTAPDMYIGTDNKHYIRIKPQNLNYISLKVDIWFCNYGSMSVNEGDFTYSFSPNLTL